MGDTATTSNPRCTPAWPKDALRVVFGVIWAIDAAFKWTPGFRSGYMGDLTGQAKVQPGWLHPWFTFWINLQHPRAIFFAYLVAVIETLIAAALVVGFARKLTYVSAAVFSFLIWSTAEGFGGPYTAGSTDVGTSIIYVVVFAGLLALSYYAGPARYSADYYLEKRYSWWWKLAELHRPVGTAGPGSADPGTTPGVPVEPLAQRDDRYHPAQPVSEKEQQEPVQHAGTSWPGPSLDRDPSRN